MAPRSSRACARLRIESVQNRPPSDHPHTRSTNGFSKKVAYYGHAMALHFLYYNFVPQHLNESFMPPFVIPTASATVSIPRDRMTLVMRGNVIGCGGHFLADARPWRCSQGGSNPVIRRCRAQCPVCPKAEMAGRFMGARLERSIAARLAARKIGSHLRTGEPGPSRCAILDL